MEKEFNSKQEVIEWLIQKVKAEYKTLRDLDSYKCELLMDGEKEKAQIIGLSCDSTRCRWGMLTDLLNELGVDI